MSTTPVYTYTYDHIHVRTKDPEGMAGFFRDHVRRQGAPPYSERRGAPGGPRRERPRHLYRHRPS